MISKQAKSRFNDLLEGYSIINALIENKDRLVLVTKNTGAKNANLKSDDEVTTEFILYNSNHHSKKHGVTTWYWEQGIERVWGGFVGDENESTVFCDSDASTCEFVSDKKWGQNTDWKEMTLPDIEFPMLRGLWGCAKIDNRIYVCGSLRKLYKRVGVQKWQDLTDERKHPNLHADLVKLIKQDRDLVDANAGFLSVDGFNQNDICAAGDAGDVWHYDGNVWTRLDPPTNFNMQAVLCAPDGFIYIAGVMGHIIKGRFDKYKGESWEILDSPITEMIHSLAWFKDKVYIGVEYGLYTIDKDGKVEEYQFPDNGSQQISFRNVTACDEALLSYGADQALIFDGVSWEQVAGKIILAVPEAFNRLTDS